MCATTRARIRARWHGLGRVGIPRFMFGKRLWQASRRVKGKFDPNGVSIPARSCMRRIRDRTKFRYGRITPRRRSRLTRRSAYTGSGGGFQGAVEMCKHKRRLPQIHRRRDVPVLSGHARLRRDVTARARNSLGSRSPANSAAMRWTSDEMARR